jgi:hypothetical protein
MKVNKHFFNQKQKKMNLAINFLVHQIHASTNLHLQRLGRN